MTWRAAPALYPVSCLAGGGGHFVHPPPPPAPPGWSAVSGAGWGERSRVEGSGAFSSAPSWCPELPSPSSPPPPLPSPALPLVPGSLRRTHHDGRRRAAPDSVSTRDGGLGCARRREARAPRDALGGSRRAGPRPGLTAAPWLGWRGRLVHSSSVPFSLGRKLSSHSHLPEAWVLFRPFPLAPFFAHLS